MYLYRGPVPKTLCPRCGGPIDPDPARRPRSRVRHADRRPITICHECGMDETVQVRTGQRIIPDSEWPVAVTRHPKLPEHENDLNVKVEDEKMILDGVIRDPTMIKLIQDAEAEGRTWQDVMEEAITKGVEGIKEMYSED